MREGTVRRHYWTSEVKDDIFSELRISAFLFAPITGNNVLLKIGASTYDSRHDCEAMLPLWLVLFSRSMDHR